jgi:integrase
MKQFNEPKIYTGGVDTDSWGSLSSKEKKDALSKRWYIYYSYRDPQTKKLKRQPNLTMNANRHNGKTERLEILQLLKLQLKLLLNSGFNPYDDNQYKYGSLKSVNQLTFDPTTINKVITENIEITTGVMCIDEAFKMALEQKKAVMASSSYTRYKSRIKKLEVSLSALYDLEAIGIDKVIKADITAFLNETLVRTSARNRNNTRTDISSLFQVLEDNDIIKENFIKKIKVLKAIPERNKTYTLDLQVKLFKHLIEHDAIMLLFVKFISYNFLRPIEVCRLKVKDIDLVQKKLYVRAKNKAVKTKIIPEILLKDLNIQKLDPDSLLFTPEALGAQWEANEGSRRDHFTKRFKKVKDEFGLGVEYGLYSFRHTFITKLYHEFIATMTPAETKGKLMLITGHSTMKALDAYLRDLDAVLPEDYSEHLWRNF